MPFLSDEEIKKYGVEKFAKLVGPEKHKKLWTYSPTYSSLFGEKQKEHDPFLKTEKAPVKPNALQRERGLIGDIGSNIARGVADLSRLTGHALKVADPEGGIDIAERMGQSLINITDKAERLEALKPDISEQEGEGWLKRGVMGGLRSAVPSLAPTVTGALTGAAMGAFIPVIGPGLGALIGGGAATLGLFGLGTYGEKKEEYLQQGIPEPEADKAAMKQGLIEGGGEAVASMLGLYFLGPGKLFAQPLKATVEELLKTPAKTWGANLAKTMGEEVVTEMIQEGLQAGVETGLVLPDGTTLREPGAWQEAALEAIVPAMTMSLLFGMGAGGYTQIQKRKLTRDLNNLEDPEAREKAVETIENGIREKEKADTEEQGLEKTNHADAWSRMALEKIDNEQEINLQQDFVNFASQDEETLNQFRENANSYQSAQYLEVINRKLENLSRAKRPTQRQLDNIARLEVEKEQLLSDIESRKLGPGAGPIIPEGFLSPEEEEALRSPGVSLADREQQQAEIDRSIQEYRTYLEGQEGLKQEKELEKIKAEQKKLGKEFEKRDPREWLTPSSEAAWDEGQAQIDENVKLYRKHLEEQAGLKQEEEWKSELRLQKKIQAKKEELQALKRKAQGEVRPREKTQDELHREERQKEIEGIEEKERLAELEETKTNKETQALDMMLKQALGSKTKTLGRDEEGKIFAIPADSPRWMQELKGALSRNDIELLITKYQNKKPFTKKQQEKFDQYIKPSLEIIQADHADEFMEEADYKKEGFKSIETDLIAANLNPGDLLLGFEGMPGQAQVLSNDGNEVVIKLPGREETRTIDFFDTLPVQAFKEGKGEVSEIKGFAPKPVVAEEKKAVPVQPPVEKVEAKPVKIIPEELPPNITKSLKAMPDTELVSYLDIAKKKNPDSAIVQFAQKELDSRETPTKPPVKKEEKISRKVKAKPSIVEKKLVESKVITPPPKKTDKNIEDLKFLIESMNEFHKKLDSAKAAGETSEQFKSVGINNIIQKAYKFFGIKEYDRPAGESIEELKERLAEYGLTDKAPLKQLQEHFSPRAEIVKEKVTPPVKESVSISKRDIERMSNEGLRDLYVDENDALDVQTFAYIADELEKRERQDFTKKIVKEKVTLPPKAKPAPVKKVKIPGAIVSWKTSKDKKLTGKLIMKTGEFWEIERTDKKVKKNLFMHDKKVTLVEKKEVKAVEKKVEKPQLSTTTKPSQEINLESVQKYFRKRNQTVGFNKDGSLWVRLKNGMGFDIEVVEKFSPEEYQMAISSGLMDETGDIAGNLLKNRIKLSSDFATQETLDHELIHLMENTGVLTKSDLSIIDKQINKFNKQGKLDFELFRDKRENRAYFLAQALAERQKYRGTPLGRILQKIADFIADLIYIGRQSTRKIAKEFETGKLFERVAPQVPIKAMPQRAAVKMEKQFPETKADVSGSQDPLQFSARGVGETVFKEAKLRKEIEKIQAVIQEDVGRIRRINERLFAFYRKMDDQISSSEEAKIREKVRLVHENINKMESRRTDNFFKRDSLEKELAGLQLKKEREEVKKITKTKDQFPELQEIQKSAYANFKKVYDIPGDGNFSTTPALDLTLLQKKTQDFFLEEFSHKIVFFTEPKGYPVEYEVGGFKSHIKGSEGIFYVNSDTNASRIMGVSFHEMVHDMQVNFKDYGWLENELNKFVKTEKYKSYIEKTEWGQSVFYTTKEAIRQEFIPDMFKLASQHQSFWEQLLVEDKIKAKKVIAWVKKILRKIMRWAKEEKLEDYFHDVDQVIEIMALALRKISSQAKAQQKINALQESIWEDNASIKKLENRVSDFYTGLENVSSSEMKKIDAKINAVYKNINQIRERVSTNYSKLNDLKKQAKSSVKKPGTKDSFQASAKSQPKAIQFSIDRSDPLSIPDNSTVAQTLKYQLVDRLDPFRIAQKTLGAVPTEADILTKETLRISKAKEAINKAEKEFFAPIKALIAKGKKTIADVNEFLYSRHAKEANERLKYTTAKEWLLKLDKLRNSERLRAKIKKIDTELELNPFMEPQQAYYLTLQNEFSKVIEEKELKLKKSWEEFAKKPSGMTNVEAADLQKKWAGDQTMKDIAVLFDEMNQKALYMSFKAGRMTEEEYKAVKGTFDFYAPLQREGYDSQPTVGRGITNLGKDFMARGGSTKRAVNLLVNAMNQYEINITKAHKAESAKAFKNFVEMLPEESNFLNIIEAPTKAVYDDNGNIRRVISHDVQKNEVKFKVDGVMYLVVASKNNEHAKRIVTHIKDNPEKTGWLIESLNKVNRLLAMVNTSLNPEFLISNFMRDIQTAFVNLSDTDIAKATTQVMTDVPKAMAGLHSSLRGDDTHAWSSIIERYQKSGATIGWMDNIGDIESKVRKLDKEIELLRPSKDITQKGFRRQYVATKKATIKVFDTIMDYNQIVENAVRLSTFKAAIDPNIGGLTDEKAAVMAKELTVNFNQKGVMGSVINSLYLFSNAGIQGSAKIFSVLKSSKRAKKIVGASIMLSIGLALANREIGGEDEDDMPYYDKIDHFVKERNIIIMRPGTKGKYIKIPLPWGYNVFWAFGEEIGAAIGQDKYSVLDGASRMLTTTLNAFNPLQSATIAQTLSPTIADPFVQVAENKTWSGAPLMPEGSPYAEITTPESELYWPSARQPSIYIARLINTLSLGNQVVAGKIDISPETLDLVWDSFTGGAGKFLANAVNVPSKMISGEEISLREKPFVRKVLGEKSEYADIKLFKKNSEYIYQLHEQAKIYPEKRKALRRDKAYNLLSTLKSIEKQIRKRKQFKKKTKKQNLKDRADKNIRSLKVKFNKIYNKRTK